MNQICFFRKGLILLSLLAVSLARAQTVDTSYKNQINATLAGLSKTRVPNKLLINQAMEFAELSDYSGSFTSTNWATSGKLTSIYNTLVMARVNPKVLGMENPEWFKSNWNNLRSPGKIVLSGLYYKYSKIKPDAYPDYLVNNNGVVTDKFVNGVWQNPYVDQHVFAIAAPILVYKKLSMKVVLPESLWYTNQASTIQSIAIDFGDGLGYQTMTLGQLKTITYTASGVYEWKYRLKLTNLQILYSHSKIKIDAPESTPQRQAASSGQVTNATAYCPDVDSISFQGTRNYLNIANSATLQIKYLNNDCMIRKPFIIVEGFDSGLLGTENGYGEADYFTFRNKACRQTVTTF
ncbi:hypothetical protein [Flavobacterium sp. 3HN19-14]|uniref:hypothetical protein n=1 Tax=Flavobacterium sp. 3HN19-14 TaxID=3448133 RepID=UPI003EDF974A